MGHSSAHHTFEVGTGYSKISCKPALCSAHPHHSSEQHLGRLLLGRKISKQRIQGVGGVVQCHGAKKEEATGDGAMKKRRSWQRRKKIKFGDKVLVSILSSLVNLFPTNLRSGLSQFSGFLHSVTLKGIEQGHFSRPLPLSSQGDESQMSGHADETVGEQQAGRVDGSFAFHPHEHNQIFKWDPS